MKKPVLFSLLLFSFPIAVFAQTFTDNTGGTIYDNPVDTYFPFTVSGLPTVIDTSFGLEQVCINLTHTWDDDLVISVIAPDGTEFELSSRNGGSDDNYTNTCFSYAASTPIYQGSAPFTGNFQPEGAMSAVNNGQNPNGVWTLHFHDVYPADNGYLYSWSLTFGNNPATPYPFSKSYLPLVVIRTMGGSIQDEPKVMADMKIVYNGPGLPNYLADSGNVYTGKIGIEIRGNSSAGFPKKSYGFETRLPDSSSLDVPLLSLPSDNDWVLIANFSDKSMLRNYYTYHLYRKMGHWSPRMEFCEVVLDGEYQGIYCLGEKVKRGNDRVNVAALQATDTSGSALTGGYIFKLDWEDPGDVYWSSDFNPVGGTNPRHYIFEYPKQPVLQQRDYLEAYVDSFEYAMNDTNFADTLLGYRRFADEEHFMDYIIVSEFTKNVDGYRLSTFLHKDKDEKIKPGPLWDYDLSWGNADYMDASYPGGWNFESQENYTDLCPFWWRRFFEDSLFMEHLHCRWWELRQSVFDPGVIKQELDSISGLMDSALETNFDKWPILGTYVWPNPSPIPNDYPGELSKLKDWVDFRVSWLDNHWPVQCQHFAGTPELSDLQQPVLFPNPNPGTFGVQTPGNAEGRLVIYDISGRVVFDAWYFPGTLVQLGDMPSGWYTWRWTGDAQAGEGKFIVVH